MPQLGDQAPDFEADTTAGRIRFHEWLGSGWAVLVSHVTDFGAVCTGELHRLAELAGEFEQRGCKLLGLSTDAMECHRRWADDERASLGFPLVADPHGVVARLYGMIHPQEGCDVAVRSVLVISPDRTVRLVFAYPPNTGRNFQEVLRALDALQLTRRHQVATPVDWQPGNEVIVLPPHAETGCVTPPDINAGTRD